MFSVVRHSRWMPIPATAHSNDWCRILEALRWTQGNWLCLLLWRLAAEAFDRVLHRRWKDLERQVKWKSHGWRIRDTRLRESFCIRTALPLYVNELLGYDGSLGRILARDNERRSYLSSKDGTLWFVITKEEYESAASSSDFHPAIPVPANGRNLPSTPRPDHIPPWSGEIHVHLKHLLHMKPFLSLTSIYI